MGTQPCLCSGKPHEVRRAVLTTTCMVRPSVPVVFGEHTLRSPFILVRAPGVPEAPGLPLRAGSALLPATVTFGGGGVLWLHGGPGPRATDYERKCLSCVHKQLPPPPLRMSSAFRPLQLQVYLLRGNLRAIFPRITLASPRLPLPSPSHSPTACLGTPPGPGKAACGAKSGNRSEAWEQRQPRGLSQLKAHWGERGGGSPATQAGQHLGGRSCPRVRL